MLKNSQERSYPLQEARINRQIAKVYFQSNDFELAYRHTRKAIQIANQLKLDEDDWFYGEVNYDNCRYKSFLQLRSNAHVLKG